MSRAGWAGLLFVVVVAVAARLLSWSEIADGPLPHFHVWTESDMAFFHRWAEDIAAGDVLTATRMRPEHSWHRSTAREAYALLGGSVPFDATIGDALWDEWLGARTFYQDPLYPYLVAGIYRVAGVRIGAVVLVQALLGVLGAGLAWYLGRRLFGAVAGVIAGLLVALYGPALFYESLLLRDAPLAAVGLATIAVLLATAERPRSGGWAFTAGLLLGLGFLLRSSTLLFALAAGGLVVRHVPAQRLRVAALLALGFLVPTSMLVARNVAVGAPPLSVAASGPLAFMAGNAVGHDPARFDAVSPHAPAILAHSHGRWLPVVRETIGMHGSLGAWLRLLWGKLDAFWQAYELPDNADYYYYRQLAPRTAVVSVSFVVVATLAVVGVCTAVGRGGFGAALLLTYVAVGIATNVLFFTASRLRLPIVLALAPFAAAGVLAIAGALRARRPLLLVVLLLVAGGTAAAVLRPRVSGVLMPRVADVGVGNEIAAHLTRRMAADGAREAAVRFLERHLALTEPPELANLDPSTGDTSVPVRAAAVAGSFVPLHELAVGLYGLTDPSRREVHARQALLEGVVARQFAQAGGASP